MPLSGRLKAQTESQRHQPRGWPKESGRPKRSQRLTTRKFLANDVLLVEHGLQHGVLDVANDLEAELVGYKVRGHSSHTLKSVHRLILEVAVKTYFDADEARWAAVEAAHAWVTPPDDARVVERCTPKDI